MPVTSTFAVQHLKKFLDTILERYCAENTESCLRDILLRGLGSFPIVKHNTAFCTVCCTVPNGKLDILKPGTRQYHKRPVSVCT